MGRQMILGVRRDPPGRFIGLLSLGKIETGHRKKSMVKTNGSPYGSISKTTPWDFPVKSCEAQASWSYSLYFLKLARMEVPDGSPSAGDSS